jgi:hypothetical protein
LTAIIAEHFKELFHQHDSVAIAKGEVHFFSGLRFVNEEL